MDFQALYGQIAGNTSVNEAIYACFEDLPEEQVHKIAKKMVHLVRKADDRTCLNAFHELLFGAHLARHGRDVLYEPDFNGQTPDWAILDGKLIECIVECVTHHEAAATREQLERATAKGEIAVVWVGNGKRLFDRIDEKAGRYEDLARDARLPFVAAVFGSFFSGVFPDEVKDVLETEMAHRPTLSGVLFGRHDGRGGYVFPYLPNPGATCPVTLPSGRWDRKRAT